MVAQVGVHAFAVVEHFVVVRDGEPGACFGGGALPVLHLVLQRREEALGDGVVPTHHGPTHRYAHADIDAVGDVCGGGVFRSSVVVNDRSRLQMPEQARHLQGVDHQRGAHVVGNLPAHHHARGQVDHGRQIQPPLTGAQVGDVTDQARAWLVGGEVPIEQIIGVVIAFCVGGGHPIRPRLHRLQAEFTHHISHQPHRAGMPAIVRYLRDVPAPVGVVEFGEHLAHFDGQFSPASRRRGDRIHLPAPVIKHRPGHSQDRTHPPDRIRGLLRFDQRAALTYGLSLGEEGRCFLKNSFSIHSLRI